ncbi:hypothetical protein B0H14DRAFT_3165134 [Mycena olivaceomarginata]|nr:hypothetical protein B0H14DRAFT_3165134 [Mycena olivaceomarginata]
MYPLRCVSRECSHHQQRGVAASFLHAVCWGGSGRSGAEREENAGRSRGRTGCGVGGCVRCGGEAGRAPRLRRGEEGGVGTRHAVSIRPRLVRDGSPRPRLASPPSAPAPPPPSTPVPPSAHARVLSTCAIVWPVVRSPRVRISAACICVRSWEARGRIRCVRWDAEEEEEQREEEYAPVEERALRERERRDAQEMGRELQWGEIARGGGLKYARSRPIRKQRAAGAQERKTDARGEGEEEEEETSSSRGREWRVAEERGRAVRGWRGGGREEYARMLCGSWEHLCPQRGSLDTGAGEMGHCDPVVEGGVPGDVDVDLEEAGRAGAGEEDEDAVALFAQLPGRCCGDVSVVDVVDVDPKPGVDSSRGLEVREGRAREEVAVSRRRRMGMQRAMSGSGSVSSCRGVCASADVVIGGPDAQWRSSRTYGGGI